MQTKLPDSEFRSRIERIQEKLAENNYDAYLVHCNEADQANVRYLSDHWPIFETAGVIVPREGEIIQLCIGARFGGYSSSVGRRVPRHQRRV